jgi:hypothetical protein
VFVIDFGLLILGFPLNNLVPNSNYWLSFNLADSQACSNLIKGRTSLTFRTSTINLIDSTIPSTNNRVGNKYYWSNPYRTCPTT